MLGGHWIIPGNGACHTAHVRVEPCAEPFVDDLLLGRDFVHDRAVPLLRSTESQPLIQGFVKTNKNKKKRITHG